MPNRNDRSAVHKPSGQVKRLSPGGQQIVSGMIDDTLELARGKQEVSKEKRYKIGEHELCEPDYLQVLEWAKQQDLKPEVFLGILLCENSTYYIGAQRHFWPMHTRTVISGGSIIAIFWDCNALPIKSFIARHEFHLNSFEFSNYKIIEEIILSNLPRFGELKWNGNRLIKLQISNLPLLYRVNCSANRIQEIKITNTPFLGIMDCRKMK